MKKVSPLNKSSFRPLSRAEMTAVKGGSSANEILCDVSGCPRNECNLTYCRCEVVSPGGVEVCNPIK